MPHINDIAAVPGPSFTLPAEGSEPAQKLQLFRHVYRDLNLVIPYSGSLLVATGSPKEPSLRMGYHIVWKYEKVYDLTFESGHLIHHIDLSHRIAEIRKRVQAQEDSSESGITARKEMEEWIAHRFDQRH